MPGTLTHIAIADKIFSIWGGSVITNIPLFFGGNLAPDAIHAKKNYQRADKKRSHLCEGIRSYGYGYPEIAKLFQSRVDEFIENYYLTAGEEKDLYLGYIVHLLVDEFYLLSTYKCLEEYLKSSGVNPDEPGFRKNLADEVNNNGHREFFSENSYIHDILTNEYDFKQNVVDVLEAVWDYEIKDYITKDEINISKRWVINKFFKNESTVELKLNLDNDRSKALKLIEIASENVTAKLLNKI